MNRRGNRAALSSLRLSPVVMAVNKKAASQREEETQTVFIILATLQVMRTNPRNFLSTTRGESRLCLCVCVCWTVAAFACKEWRDYWPHRGQGLIRIKLFMCASGATWSTDLRISHFTIVSLHLWCPTQWWNGATICCLFRLRLSRRLHLKMG